MFKRFVFISLAVVLSMTVGMPVYAQDAQPKANAPKAQQASQPGIQIEIVDGLDDNTALVFDPISTYFMEGNILQYIVAATDAEGQTLNLNVAGSLVEEFEIINSQPGRIEGLVTLSSQYAYPGVHYISYYVSDGNGGYTSALVPITVGPDDIPPGIIQPLNNRTVEVGERAYFTIVAQSIENYGIDLEVANMPENAEVTYYNSGPGSATLEFVWEPEPNQLGVHHIHFNAESEVDGLYATGILRVEVVPDEPPPPPLQNLPVMN